jgi:exodeoxyribonuclease V gamma subunit
MLTLHTSHKTEYLLAHLTQVMKSQPLPSPFDQEVFLIQSNGMERWLSQSLADQFGVFANAKFLFPHRFFSQLIGQVAPDVQSQAFEREAMVWRIESLLRKLGDSPEFVPLQA